MALPPPPSTDVFQDLESILTNLIRHVMDRRPHCAVVWRIAFLVCQRIRRARNKVVALIRRVRSGTVRVAAARRAGASGRKMDPALRERLIEIARLWKGVKRGWGWLCPLVPSHAAAMGGQLEHVLRNKAMRRVMAADPRIAQALRSVCRMIAVDLRVLEVTAEDAVGEIAPLPRPEAQACADGPAGGGIAVPWWQQPWAQ